MRDTSALGRPGWRLFPDGWEQHHYPIAQQQMTATGSIWAGPAEGENEFIYDPVTHTDVRNLGVKVWPAGTVLAGPLRFQELNQPNITTAGGQQVSTHDYRINVPVEVDDASLAGFVKITTTSDGSVHDLILKITDVQRGSLRWQRDLIVTDELG